MESRQTARTEATPTVRTAPMAVKKMAAPRTELRALLLPGPSRAEPQKREPTAETEPARLAAKPARSVRAVRCSVRSAVRRAPRNMGSRWACANQRSTSIRAAWACRTVRRRAWARGARPPLSEMGSRPKAGCGTRPASAAVLQRRKARRHPRLQRWGRREVAAQARAPALDQIPGAQSPPQSARRLLESPAMPAEPRPTKDRRASSQRTRWRCVTLHRPSPQNPKQRLPSNR